MSDRNARAAVQVARASVNRAGNELRRAGKALARADEDLARATFLRVRSTDDMHEVHALLAAALADGAHPDVVVLIPSHRQITGPPPAGPQTGAPE